MKLPFRWRALGSKRCHRQVGENSEQTRRPPAPEALAARRVMVLVTLGTFALDQLTKWWALSSLTPGEIKPLWGDYLFLSLTRNAGAAFSIGNGRTWIFTLLAIGVLLWVAWAARAVTERSWAVVVGLFAGGAAGNLLDRLVRAPGFFRGHVIDFIGYWTWFIGNVADIALVVAVIISVGLLALGARGARQTPAEENL